MNKKRILLLTDEIYPNTHANSEIVLSICAELKRKGYLCDIIGYNSSVKQNIYIRLYRRARRIFNGCNSNLSKIKKLLSDPMTLFLRILMLIFKPYAFYFKIYYLAIKYYIKKFDADAIIAFSLPIDTVLALNKFDNQITKIIFCLDPLLSRTVVKTNNSIKHLVLQAEDKADSIFLTPLMYSNSEELVSDTILQKSVVYDFPCIKSRDDIQQLYLNSDCINCVFCGNFYSDIRKPDVLFEVFNNFQDKNIVLHIIGHSQADFPEINSPNIIFHGRVSSTEALQYMKSANILVNVGNSIKNQLPSKLITYISFGKPIINFYKLPDCPTIDCLQKYPLKYNVDETKTIDSTMIEDILRFCETNNKAYIPFDVVKNLYQSNTVEYVTNQIIDVIEAKS